MDDFIFPASRMVLKQRRSGSGNTSSPTDNTVADYAIPVCSTPHTMTAAFDLLVALCTGCVQGLRMLADMLTEMYYPSKLTLKHTIVYRILSSFLLFPSIHTMIFLQCCYP